MLFQVPNQEREVQAAFVPDDVIEAWLKSYADLPVDVEGTIEDEVTPTGDHKDTSSMGNVIEFVRRS
jgi:hypothetical protein